MRKVRPVGAEQVLRDELLAPGPRELTHGEAGVLRELPRAARGEAPVVTYAPGRIVGPCSVCA